MNWIALESEKDLEEIKAKSVTIPQVIFKHSSRCSISSMVKSRLERASAPANIDFNFLDLIAHRALSNTIAEAFLVHHESPQILIIKNGQCIFDESHNGISMYEIAEQALQ